MAKEASGRPAVEAESQLFRLDRTFMTLFPLTRLFMLFMLFSLPNLGVLSRLSSEARRLWLTVPFGRGKKEWFKPEVRSTMTWVVEPFSSWDSTSREQQMTSESTIHVAESWRASPLLLTLQMKTDDAP
mmetsp:Transcript_42875/g.122271  ORF Transcript_42875/g.122271 Transcript_42875/m.122271 type:complete len:129 (-) Transcript_42875:486-872(-)